MAPARRFIEARAHLEGGHLVGESLRKRLVHFFVHVEAIRRRARLALIAHLGDHRAFDGVVDVGVVEHQERRIAAELHRGAHDVVRRLVQKSDADPSRAGERHHAHAEIVQHRANDRAGAIGRNTLTTPAGTPASSSNGISASMVSGSDAGFSTTVLKAL